MLSEQNKDKKSLINNNRAKLPIKRGVFIYGIILLLIISFGVGVLVGKQNNQIKIVSVAGKTKYGEVKNKDNQIPKYLTRDVDFKVFWQAWNIIQDKYIDRPVGETKLFYGALNGMVQSLGDPFSTFFEPKSASEFNDELSGKFQGVGMEIGIRNNVLTVISPLPGTPADRAGIRPADIITKIDGQETKNMNLYEAVNKIRGPKGTIVKLKIYRKKTDKFLDINVKRDIIKIISVKYELEDKNKYPQLGNKRIGLIKITNFNSDTAARFKEAEKKLLNDNPDGLILDLRGNPGGYLDSAIQIAEEWLKPGETIVYEKYGNGKLDSQSAKLLPKLNKYSTVILVNGGSASAAEILAGALEDNHQAVLIGEKTFGKGSVQELENLEDGSAIKITIARWLTPNKHMIDKQGIEPNIKVEMTEKDYNNFLDPQLDRALLYLVNKK